MFALDIKKHDNKLYNLGYAVQLYGLTMMVIIRQLPQICQQ